MSWNAPHTQPVVLNLWFSQNRQAQYQQIAGTIEWPDALTTGTIQGKYHSSKEHDHTICLAIQSVSTIQDGRCCDVKDQEFHNPQNLSWIAGATFKGRLCRDDGIQNVCAESGVEGSDGGGGGGTTSASLPLDCAGRGGIALKGEWQVKDVAVEKTASGDGEMVSNAQSDSEQPTKHISTAVESTDVATNACEESMSSVVQQVHR